MDEGQMQPEFDWRAFRANKPKKNHKQPRRGATVTLDKPDPSKPTVDYNFSDTRNCCPRLNPYQQELAKKRRSL